MAKEWDSWQRFDTVEILTNEQIDKLPEDAEVIGTREQSAGLLFPVFLERSSAMSGGFLFCQCGQCGPPSIPLKPRAAWLYKVTKKKTQWHPDQQSHSQFACLQFGLRHCHHVQRDHHGL
jgi:hypothetical protein